MQNFKKTLANILRTLAQKEAELEEKFSNKKPRKRKRRGLRLKKSVIAVIIAVVVCVVGIGVVPRVMQDNKLKELGYTKEDIKAIREMKLQKTLIKEGYYSPYLAACITDQSVDTDYLPLYVVRSSTEPLTQLDFLLYNRLMDRGYNQANTLKIFSKLKFFEMTPLLVFDLQADPQDYIDDCLAHRETNSTSHFELSGNYYSVYENSIPADDTNVNMLVNKTYYLSDLYQPAQVTEVSVQYATKGLQLAKEAAEALSSFGAKGQELGLRFYASSGYRDYYKQDALYTSYVASMGQEQADALSARPGYSEHQTGLTVDLAAISADGISEYKDTQEYQWTKENCMNYGFILRYPEGKTQITGYDFEPWHYRYIGVDLAQAVYASNLTYDEYYQLYLQPWNYSMYVYDYSGVNTSVRETPVVFDVKQEVEEPEEEAGEDEAKEEENKEVDTKPVG